MAIALPIMPGASSAVPFFMDMGSWQNPISGGVAARIDLLGDRYGVQVTMPPMEPEPAMAWVSRLIRGHQQQVLFEWQQPDLPDQPLGVQPVAQISALAAAQSSQISLSDVGDGNTFAEGRFFSVLHDGRHYVHHVAATAVSAGNAVTLDIFPRLRTDLAIADAVHFNPPMIEGILDGDRRQWSISTARHVGLEFTITEAE